GALRTGPHAPRVGRAGPPAAGAEPRDRRRLRRRAALLPDRRDALPRPAHLRRRHAVAREPRLGQGPDGLRQGDRDGAVRRRGHRRGGRVSEPANIRVERPGDGVGRIRIHRPERRNALKQATLAEIAEAMRAFDLDDAVGCIVLTGDDVAFAAGADVTEMDGKNVADMLGGYRFETWEAVRRVRTPIVAAVSGFALGGGLELAMACDMIVASETARLGQPEINLGIMPGAGGTQRLTRQIGKYLAMEVVLAGRLLNAEEALRHGLVNHVVPVDVYLDKALEIARVVAGRAPMAARLAKSAVSKAQDMSLEDGLAFERNAFYLLFGTEDQKEGIRAFLEKRPPAFTGR